MLSTVDQANALVVLPAARRRRPRTAVEPGTATTGLGARTATAVSPPGPFKSRARGEQPATALRTAPSRSSAPLGNDRVDVLRIVSDPRTPTYVTVYANGRRRYSYWRPLDSTTGMGGCYAALPTAECDELYAAGRIALGEPVVDPNRTTYRVSPADRVQPPVSIRVARERRHAA
ncbi:predicted protein [Streptomyces viridosporus ATCC 14672]|uniref:Predicted protein n=1 Tax=Streptomyces viridosporus (strain ATCC 14672 / DSM 40746 / JCM 4963 / KCTC 9882 / NRRL B-12104 / FH 1290) TaxID=566461 RepID=D6A164_STRV1|nr:hypothetical protein [Streptomyces viridosporus]EFE71339.1 predicted protein [Streptomyces viridosporus ATCC 14672]